MTSFNPGMAAPFLPIADRYVGFPVTLTEAVDNGLAILFGDEWRLYATVDQQVEWHADQSGLLLLWLKTGTVHSFVEDDTSGRWFRVPQQHWWAFDILSPSLDMVAGNWPGRDVGMIGRPVVVWRDASDAEFRKQKGRSDQLSPSAQVPAPHLEALLNIKTSIKPPRPEMETVQRGSASLAPRDPDPLLPVATDNLTRWVSLADAAALISAVVPNGKAAENAIMKASLDGALVLSCELLIAKPLAGGDPLFSVRRPGKDAKLGQRIDKAFKSDPLSRAQTQSAG